MLRTLKYEFMRTPLERPLMGLRQALGFLERRRHPELREIHLEGGRMDAVIERVLERGSHCVDVGCHYGSVLSLFCRYAPSGHHVAFEAMPDKVRFLRRKFPDVEVHETAICDHAGSARFYVDRKATGFSGLARQGTGGYEEFEVACARLDDLLPRDRRFDFMKVDVEGAELFVFRGAIEAIGRDRPVILFECGPSGPPAFGYPSGEIHDLLTGRLGYSVFLPKDFLGRGSPVSLASFTEALEYPFKAFNWFAAPRERLPEIFSRLGGSGRE